MERQIEVRINGSFADMSHKLAGVQGEGNVTRMRIIFDESWRGFGKRIVWRNALGLDQVSVILGADQRDGNDLTYAIMIPPEPLKEPGWCSFVIEGCTEDGGGTASVAVTASGRLEVKPGEYGAPAEPTAPEALQLQHEIDGLLESVEVHADAASGLAAAALLSEKSAAESAASASGSALSASRDAHVSKSWAAGGTGTRQGEDTDNARYWAGVAKVAAGGGPGVGSFNGRSGAVMPQAGDYTKAQVGLGRVDNTADIDKPVSRAVQAALDLKAGTSHSHGASGITAGTLGGRVQAGAAAQQELGQPQIRDITAGTEDLTAGSSALATGTIYLVYEV